MTTSLKAFTTQAQSGGQTPEVLISVDHLSKKFCRSLKRSLIYGVADIITELVGGRRRSEQLRKGEFWALQDVSFKLGRGESVGLVGANGAGKSTLLRIMSGLIKPDMGTVMVNARVAPLIALGAGFNPVLTGRENVYVNMSILGLPRKRIEERFEDVSDFAEIGDAMDAPVQTYSSGMVARLGFACAVFADADILLIDEVLAVGDLKFRAKCYRQLAKLREGGTSFILVSHNAHSIALVCDSAVYLSEGELVMADETRKVISQYEQDLLAPAPEKVSLSTPHSKQGKLGGEELSVTDVHFQDDDGNVVDSPATGSSTRLCLVCQVGKPLDDVSLIVAISSLSADSQRVLHLNSRHDGQRMRLRPGKSEIQLHLPGLGLMFGWYSAKIVVIQSSMSVLDVVESFRFRVVSDEHAEDNLFYQPRNWHAINHQQELEVECIELTK